MTMWSTIWDGLVRLRVWVVNGGAAFLLVLLPLTGFIIGRVSRSLRKQSTQSQEEMGTLMSILDETLGGLRVIKAFNAEKLLRSKFFTSN